MSRIINQTKAKIKLFLSPPPSLTTFKGGEGEEYFKVSSKWGEEKGQTTGIGDK